MYVVILFEIYITDKIVLEIIVTKNDLRMQLQYFSINTQK